jgi:dipeptidyl aminopeptidase/acylaminoacyl peptidase
MRYRHALPASLLLLAAASLPAQQKRLPTVEDLTDIRAAGDIAIAPDGRTILYTVSGWEHPAAKGADLGDTHEMRSHVWLVPADGSAPARQLTFGKTGESSPRWSSDGRLIAFIAGRGEGEAAAPQVWMMNAAGGESWQVTTIKEGVQSFAWSPDAKRLAVASRDSLASDRAAKQKKKDDAQVFEGDFRNAHLWVVELDSKNATEVVHEDGLTLPPFGAAAAWSPDGTRLAFAAAPTPMIRDERRDAFVVDVASKRVERLTSTHDVTSMPAWSPDGATLAWTVVPGEWKPIADSLVATTQANAHLVLYEVASHRAADVSSPAFDVSPGQPRWSPDGKRILFTAPDHVYESVYQYDVAARRYQRLTSGLAVADLALSPDGTRAALVVQSNLMPPEVHVADAATFASPRRLTHSNPRLDSLALGDAEVVTWKSSDGQTVEGILLKPVGYAPGKRYPMLLSVHGGPTGEYADDFKNSWYTPGQYWASKGWLVLYPNPRGSTGYGEKWMKGNIPDWGGGDYRDLMTGVDAMVARGIADSSKLAVSGWSYGGYMTAWVVSQTTRFKAAMMGAGLSDLQSMYGTTDIPNYLSSFFKGNPTEQSMPSWRARSAITIVDRVRTPLLILHGAADDRVPTGQSLEYFRALKDRGRTVQLVFYPREPHILGEWYHQLDKITREYEWIARYTLGDATKVVQ